MRRLLNSQLWQFLVFLFTPEDSSCDGYFRKRRVHAQFDTPGCGAIKIVFWMMTVVTFWILLPLLCR